MDQTEKTLDRTATFMADKPVAKREAIVLHKGGMDPGSTSDSGRSCPGWRFRMAWL